jgi:hypothetical protein
MIQRCARGWLGRLRAHRLRSEQLAMELFMKEQVGAWLSGSFCSHARVRQLGWGWRNLGD